MDSQMPNLNKKMIERGYWIATHRLTIAKWVTICISVVCALVYIVFFIQYGRFLFSTGQWDTLIAKSITPLIHWTEIHSVSKPQDISVGAPEVFARGSGIYDFAAEVSNSNTQWAVQSMSYQFAFGDGAMTASKNTFVLPGEKKFLTVFKHSSDDPIPSVSDVIVSDIKWYKIGQLPPMAWLFTKEPVYQPKQRIVTNGKEISYPAKVTWSVKNNSTLTIPSVVFQISLYSGSRLVLVTEYRVEHFSFLEEKALEYYLPDAGDLINSVAITPIVDIFDPAFPR